MLIVSLLLKYLRNAKLSNNNKKRTTEAESCFWVLVF